MRSKNSPKIENLVLSIPGVRLFLLDEKSSRIQSSKCETKNRHEHTLLFVISGCYQIYTKAKKISVVKDSVVVIYHPEDLSPTVSPVVRFSSSALLCSLDADFIAKFYNVYQDAISQTIDTRANNRFSNNSYCNNEKTICFNTTPLIKLSLQRLMVHFSKNIKNQKLLINMEIHILLLSILSQYSQFSEYLVGTNLQHSDKIKTRIQSLLMRYANSHISISDLAKIGGFSLSVFKKLSREYFGVPPRRWINKVRLQQSTELLKNENYSISDICHRIGYKSQSYFSVIFKKEFGISPKNYQKSLYEKKIKPNKIS